MSLSSFISIISTIVIAFILIISGLGHLESALILFIGFVIIIIILYRFLNYFPNLRFDILRRQAKKLAHKFPEAGIRKITIYNYHSEYFPDVPTKYAIVLEVYGPGTDDYEKLKSAAINLHTNPYDEYRAHNLGIDKSFTDVYKKQPDSGYLKEWRFFVKGQNEDLPKGIIIRRCWVLFHKRKILPSFKTCCGKNILAKK